MSAFEEEAAVLAEKRAREKTTANVQRYREEIAKAMVRGDHVNFAVFSRMEERERLKMSTQDETAIKECVKKLLEIEPANRTIGTVLSYLGYDAASGNPKEEERIKRMALVAIAEATRQDADRPKKLFLDPSGKPLPLPIETSSAMALFEADVEAPYKKPEPSPRIRFI